jgi:hypothetical protein
MQILLKGYLMGITAVHDSVVHEEKYLENLPTKR